MTMTVPPQADWGQAMTAQELRRIFDEIAQQPPWRAQADREADYADGNQLDSDLLAAMRRSGIPPAKENVIGPAIATLCGHEAKTRTDWRVTPDGDTGGQDVADALNYRLNQAERNSRADDAMSEAFRSQVAVGLGWVEVARASDPFAFPLRCRSVHRNEIYWQMGREKDLSDSAWLLRERFVRRSQAAAAFPAHQDLIASAMHTDVFGMAAGAAEGGVSTGLMPGLDAARAWTAREARWYRSESDEVCIVELWYRRWVRAQVLRVPGGRVVEFDADNPMHQAAAASGMASLQWATLARVRRSYWMGPHCLHDGPSPYPHPHFPYVPFWGWREDMTGVPFGVVRDMMFAQDNLNSTIAKLRWGLASTRVERTEGAALMSDDQLRRAIARPDADVVLNAARMAQPGARFEVKRDFQLSQQHFQLMADARASIERVSGVTSSLMGKTGTARSGLQEQTQLEQSQVAIAALMDNFRQARRMVGEMLMAMLIEDMGQQQEVVVIEGDALNPPRAVELNKPETDPQTGLLYLSNDVQRARLKVALEDVPTSSSFRAQQLSALSEAIKALPAQAQQAALPFLIDLMDLPRKAQVVQALEQAAQTPDANALRAQVKQELMHDIKERELALKESLGQAQREKLRREAVQVGVQSAYSAMQAGAQVAQMPQIAPVADAVMQGAGYQKPQPAGQDPDFPVPQDALAAQEAQAAPPVRQNTSPAFPPVPQQPGDGLRGVETPRTADNLGG